jgi:hypothetical protein
MTAFTDQASRLAAHVPNGELLAATDPAAFMAAAADELDRLQSTVDHDTETQPCGHANHWIAYRNPAGAGSALYCVFCEMERLQAIVDRLPKTADGVHVIPGEDTVWHPDMIDCDGELHAMALDIDHGAAWWRLPNQRYPIEKCCSTREAAEKARIA